jgi:hypothetical protein
VFSKPSSLSERRILETLSTTNIGPSMDAIRLETLSTTDIGSAMDVIKLIVGE